MSKTVATLFALVFLMPFAPSRVSATQVNTPPPVVASFDVAEVQCVPGSTDKAQITIAILGRQLASVTAISLHTKDGRMFSEPVKDASPERITARFELPLGVTVDVVGLVTSLGVIPIPATTFDVKLSAAEDTPLPEVEVVMSPIPSGPYPNLFSLVLSSKSPIFDSNPNHMSVELVPSGATNVRVRPGTTSKQMVVDYVAAEKFEVKDVLVSVYDGSDLDNRHLTRIGKTVKEFRPDPAQPTISKIELLFLRRHGNPNFGGAAPNSSCFDDASHGIGRLKIEGSGFGSDPKSISISIAPRNPSIIIDHAWVAGTCSTTATTAELGDKYMLVDFSFVIPYAYSEPLRIASVTLSVTKPVTEKKKQNNIEVTVAKPGNFVVSKDVGPKRDDTLEYRYTILDQTTASQLFGGGVGKYFYVIQLSVVNKGDKKVAVPLSAVQAEIEWVQMPGKEGNVEFLEGPPTLSPIPLEAVSGFFDADVKTKGKKALLFNILAGVTTFGGTLVPLFGPGFQQAHTIYTSGLVPGIKTALGDLSGQQLQNLTGLSWQNVEAIPPHGGAVEKFIYIQRGQQDFSTSSRNKSPLYVLKQITNILDLEVTGFEILESEPKEASKK